MKTLVLAAGYATRLYPLTENFPKPLLPIRGKTILDGLLEDCDGLPEIDGHIVVGNHRFTSYFESWKAGETIAVPGVWKRADGVLSASGEEEGNGVHYSASGVKEKTGGSHSIVIGHESEGDWLVQPKTVSGSRLKKPVTVLDDGSVSNETRLGAVKDILFAIQTLGLNDDLLVLAGDNVVDFSFGHFVQFSREKNASAIMCYEESRQDMLKKGGVVSVGQNGRVLSMMEKPEVPPSRYAVPPFYVYRKEELTLLEAAIADGCGTDAPGSLVAWMCQNRPMYAWEMKVDGRPVYRYDVGDLEAYIGGN